MLTPGKYQEFDQRHNIYNIGQLGLEKSVTTNLKTQAESVGCLILEKFLEKTDSKKHYQLNSQAQTFAQRIESALGVPLGEKEAFYNEFSIGEATAFFIGKKLALTAAHVVCDENSDQLDLNKIKNLRLIFGFQMIQENQCKTIFEKKSVYKIKNVVAHNYDRGIRNRDSFWQDWALIKLARPVEDLIPLKLNFCSQYTKGMKLYMLGFPFGQPEKFTGNGKITSVSGNDGDKYFQADLDAFKGGSGSPVFNDKHEVIGILCSGHDDLELVSDYRGSANARIQLKTLTKKDIALKGWEKCQRLDTLKFIQAFMEPSSLPPDSL
jgi:V8-like Glu-specific endopeptidase